MIRLLFSLVFLLCFTACTLPQHTTALNDVMDHEIERRMDWMPPYRCTIGAHRGASVEHRENSLAAIEAAELDDSYAFVEFDVQYTEDQQIVVFHDNRLLRVYGSLASVSKSTYEELLEKSDGEIALYSDVMDVLTKKVNIEIKSQGDEEEDKRLADAIIADLIARDRLEDLMLSSISSDVIRYVSDKYPEIPTGQIYWVTFSTFVNADDLTRHLYKKFSETQADYIMLNVANFRNIEGLLKLKPEGKTVMFWDFDDRMYLVHKDLGDRLWGSSSIGSVWDSLRFKLN